jgi:hypothetical protein
MVDSGRQIRKVGGQVGAEMRTHIRVSVRFGAQIVAREGVVAARKSILGKGIR